MVKKYSVLVVDDQENWRELLVELLEDEFEVTSVDSYDAALEKIRERSVPFHVVVTDMRLVDEESGNEDGLELAGALNQRGSATEIIVLTGYPTLRTAKNALGRLDVFDYLEKRPEDGSSFNTAEFLRIVKNAAENAEEKRPRGLTLENSTLLLLVSETALREKLRTILSRQCEVTVFEIAETLPQALKNTEKSFMAVLISEDLYARQEALDVLQAAQPQAKIILLTETENPTIEMTHHYPIAKVISVSPTKPDRLKILDGIQQAILSAYAKFGIIEIEMQGEKQDVSENIQLLENRPYTFWLRMQNTSTLESFPINLSATKKGEKNENINLDVFVVPMQMEIAPGGKLPWNITKPLEFQVIPTAKGKKKLLLEVRQGYRLAGKKEISLEIS